MNKLSFFKLFIILFLIPSTFNVRGATYVATGLTSTEVQAAIDLCSAGDTALMPVGTNTWTSTVTVPKGVYLAGSGSGTTKIFTTSGVTPALLLSSGGDTRLHDFTMYQADDTIAGDQVVNVNSVTNFIFYNLEITNIIRRGMVFDGGGSGVHSHGVLYNSRLASYWTNAAFGGGFQQVFTFLGNDLNYPGVLDGQNTEEGNWKFAPGVGTGNMPIIEDCILDMYSAGDSGSETYFGGKATFRHNTGENFWWGVHGPDSSIRSGHWYDVNNNTINVTIGNSYAGLSDIRGGAAVFWNNALTYSGTKPTGGISLQSYRSHGREVVDAVFASQFPYSGSQLNGFVPYDGNQPYRNDGTAVGTHTGGNNVATLTDSTKAWTSNEWLLNGNVSNNNLESGVHDGSGNSATLTDSTRSWTTDALVGDLIQNWTDFATTTSQNPSAGVVTANTATTITATLTSPRDWDVGDIYLLRSADVDGGNVVGWLSTAVIWNDTDGSRAFIRANSATTVTMDRLVGGTDNDWDTGDQYHITIGYPGYDQMGIVGPTTFTGTNVLQTSLGIYEWDNTLAGNSNDVYMGVAWLDANHTNIHQPDSSFFVQEGRDMFNDTAMPGYVGWTYPDTRRLDATMGGGNKQVKAVRGVMITNGF